MATLSRQQWHSVAKLLGAAAAEISAAIHATKRVGLESTADLEEIVAKLDHYRDDATRRSLKPVRHD